MRSSRRNMWLPFVAAMAGLVASPLIAQDTSEESAKTDQTKHKVVVVEGGQIVISDADGKAKVMKLKKDGENTFVWTQESGEQTEGSPKTGLFRAILVGPDGKQEVELHIDGADGEWHAGPGVAGHLLHMLPAGVDGEHLQALLNTHVSGFMVGVSCGELNDTLKKQLGIESGLVVESIVTDSPADGKLEVHDIIIQAGDVNLTEIGQLIEAVQAAGEAEKELALTLLRSGKKENVSLTPKKREMAEGMNIESLGEKGILLKLDPEMKSVNGFDFETVGPGVIEFRTEGSTESADDLKAEIESLRQKLEELSGKLDGDK